MVIHSPLPPKDARARIRRHLAGDSLGSQFVEVQPGWYVVGWLQTSGFKLCGMRRMRPQMGWSWPRVISTPWMRGSIVAESEGSRLEGRFDPTTVRSRWSRRVDAAMVEWLREILEARPDPPTAVPEADVRF